MKQDTLSALRTAPVHLQSLFQDQLLIKGKAEEEVSRSEERHSVGQSHRKQGRFHPYVSNDKSSQQPDRKSVFPAWKQIRDRQQAKKGRGKPSTFSQCVNCVTGLKDCACVSGQISLNPSPMIAGSMDLTSKSETVNSHVNSCVVNAHSVIRLPQKKGVIPSYCQNYTEIKYICKDVKYVVKDVSCVGHLSFCKSCHKCPNCCFRSSCRCQIASVLGKMGSPGGNSQGGNITQRGLHPPLPVHTQLYQVTNCHKQLCDPHKNLHLLEALYQLVN